MRDTKQKITVKRSSHGAKSSSMKSWRKARIFLWFAVAVISFFTILVPSLPLLAGSGFKNGIILDTDLTKGYTVRSGDKTEVIRHECPSGSGRNGMSNYDCQSSDFVKGNNIGYLSGSGESLFQGITMKALLDHYLNGFIAITVLVLLIRFVFKDNTSS